eukprot:scaffold27601_cov130-Isochrysis_galbana.AAC.3
MVHASAARTRVESLRTYSRDPCWSCTSAEEVRTVEVVISSPSVKPTRPYTWPEMVPLQFQFHICRTGRSPWCNSAGRTAEF